MKYRYLLLFMAAALSVASLSAQSKRKSARKNAVKAVVAQTNAVDVVDTAQIVRNYIDSLTVLRSRVDSLQRVNESLRSESDDGRFYRLFAPTTFYHSGAQRYLSLMPQTGDEVTDAVDDAMMSLYMRRPDLVKNNESQLIKSGTLREDVNQELTQQVELVDNAAPVPEEPKFVPAGIRVQKPNFWKFKGDGFLQFLQNYVSGNWHKGGESNYSAVGAVTLELNYNDKDKVKFENKLEMKLGFQTSRSDTVHMVKPNNDLLRLTSKLGLQAHKQWYYTIQFLAQTQFTRGLKSNDRKTYSDFCSPLDLNVGIGMDYKFSWLGGKLTGDFNISPLSVNYRYVDRTALAAGFGVKTDKHTHSLTDFGSQLTANVKWKLAEQISWKSRLYAYTSYHRTLIEWENQFELKVSRYITANLFLYPRFDDTNRRDSELGYWQFQEYSSLGLSYTF
jgi:hypothetical protein